MGRAKIPVEASLLLGVGHKRKDPCRVSNSSDATNQLPSAEGTCAMF